MERNMKLSTFKFLKQIAFWVIPPYRVNRPEPVGSPAVYLVHHQNLRGPLLTCVWFDKPVRPWALHVFCDRATCFQQYYHYTLTERMGLPKWLAYIPARLMSALVSGLMPHLKAIPVYRGTQAIYKTFRQSLAALRHGDDLLIIPDIDYTDRHPSIGEIHRGFLYLDRFYYKATGHHLDFVPLHVSKKDRQIKVGHPVRFSEGDTFRKEQDQVYDRILVEFRRLEAADAGLC
jgi:hypothetical protein